jgi:hypothetical protein
LTALVLTLAVLFSFTASTAYAKNAKHNTPTSKPVVHNPNAKTVFAPKTKTLANSHSGYGQKARPNFTGSGTTSFANFQQTLPFAMAGGYDVAIAPDQYGNFFVADYLSGNVYEESPDGNGGFTESLIFTVDPQGPTGIAVDAYDDLYIANDYTAEVFFAYPSGGSWNVTQIATGGVLTYPYSIAVDQNYNLYIADWSGGIYEMHWSGGNVWTTPYLLFTSPYPLGVAVDYMGENLYVADNNLNYPYQVTYDNGTSSWDIFHDIGTNLSPATGWSGIALTNNQTVYAANNEYGTLLQFVPSEFGYTGNLISDQFDNPYQVSVDATNTVYVADYGYAAFYGFINNFGSEAVDYTSPNLVDVNFWLANGVTTGFASIVTTGSTQWTDYDVWSDSCSNITSSGQYCTVSVIFDPYTVGSVSGAVTLVDSTGAYLASSQSFYGTGLGSQSTILPGTYNFFGGPYSYASNAPSTSQARQNMHLKNAKDHTASVKPNFTNYNYPGILPMGIVTDSHSDIFVADQGYANGSLSIPCNIYATYDQQTWVALPMYNFLCPSGGLAIDGSGNLFYTVWFDNAGTSEASIAVSYLETPAYYDSGLGVEVPAVYSYPFEVATDTANNYGYLLHADAVAVDNSDNVYFTGSDYSYLDDYVYVVPANNYEGTGNYAISVLPAPFNNKLGYNAFQLADGIAVDNYSDVYVTDYYTGTVHELYPTTTGYNYNWIAGAFDTPTSISLDNNGNLYVLDSGDDSGVSSLNLLFPNGSCWNYSCFTSVPLITSPYSYGYSYFWNFGVDTFNDFYFTDFGYWGGLITYVDTYDPMTINFNETALGVTSTDSPEFVYLFSSGNQPLNFSIPVSGYNPSVPANFTLNTQSFYYFPGTHIPISDCQQLNSGSTVGYSVTTDYACALPLSFDPLTAGVSTGPVVLTDDSYASWNYAAPAGQGNHALARKASKNHKKPMDGSTYYQDVVDVSGIGDQVTPTIVMVSNWNPSLVQNSVAFAINVTGPGVDPTTPPPPPPSTDPCIPVLLLDGVTQVGSGCLVNGATTISVVFTTTGTHNMTAVYQGDSNYTGVTSAVLPQVVVDFSAAFQSGGGSPTFCQSTPIVRPGDSLTLAFTIAPVAPATIIPGPISFSADGAPVGTTYVFSPDSIATGSGSTPVTLTLTIPLQFVADLNKPQGNNSKLPIAPLALAVLLLPLAGRMRKTSKRLIRMLSVALFVIAGISATAALSGCGANTTATYEVVVTTQSGTLFHSFSCDIIVR